MESKLRNALLGALFIACRHLKAYEAFAAANTADAVAIA
jgi:hypothetical protein